MNIIPLEIIKKIISYQDVYNLLNTCKFYYYSKINIKPLRQRYLDMLKENGYCGIRGNYKYNEKILNLYQHIDSKFNIIAPNLEELYIWGNFGSKYIIPNNNNLKKIFLRFDWYSSKFNPELLFNKIKNIPKINIWFYKLCNENEKHMKHFNQLKDLFKNGNIYNIEEYKHVSVLCLKYNSRCIGCGGYCSKTKRYKTLPYLELRIKK